MSQIPSWEANSWLASQEIPYPLWYSKVHHRVHNSPVPWVYKTSRNKNYIIQDVNYVLGFLHRVIMSDSAHVSEVHTASIFRIELQQFDHIQNTVELGYNVIKGT
jgi:hypothetical protein